MSAAGSGWRSARPGVPTSPPSADFAVCPPGHADGGLHERGARQRHLLQRAARPRPQDATRPRRPPLAGGGVGAADAGVDGDPLSPGRHVPGLRQDLPPRHPGRVPGPLRGVRAAEAAADQSTRRDGVNRRAKLIRALSEMIFISMWFTSVRRHS